MSLMKEINKVIGKSVKSVVLRKIKAKTDGFVCNYVFLRRGDELHYVYASSSDDIISEAKKVAEKLNVPINIEPYTTIGHY
jgi:hypothetical protein